MQRSPAELIALETVSIRRRNFSALRRYWEPRGVYWCLRSTKFGEGDLSPSDPDLIAAARIDPPPSMLIARRTRQRPCLPLPQGRCRVWGTLHRWTSLRSKLK
jgi:hypothetical protein